MRLDQLTTQIIRISFRHRHSSEAEDITRAVYIIPVTETALVSYSIVWLPVGLTTLLIKFAMLQRGGMGSVGRAAAHRAAGHLRRHARRRLRDHDRGVDFRDAGEFDATERLPSPGNRVVSRVRAAITLRHARGGTVARRIPSSGPVLYEPDLKVPGVIQELKGLGYQTAAYLPATLVLDWEEWMFKAMGFGQMRVADQILDDVPNARKNWKVKKRVDEVSLGTLKEDIRHWAAEDQRFAAAYLPQIGHAPWPDILEDGVDRDTRERGREILRLEDRWLGEILDLLDELDMRKRTMIVLAGDHGVRNSFEDPSYDAGRPSERAFHVPLMVNVPGLTEDRRTTGWPTSHIDLAPTLLDLLGVETGREWEQGSPLLEQRLAERTTFYRAHLMEGVRGYRSPEHFALWNGMLGAVYVHQRNTFEDIHQTENSSALYRDVTSRLTAIEELQRAWLRKSLGGTGASRTDRSGAQGGQAAN